MIKLFKVWAASKWQKLNRPIAIIIAAGAIAGSAIDVGVIAAGWKPPAYDYIVAAVAVGLWAIAWLWSRLSNQRLMGHYLELADLHTAYGSQPMRPYCPLQWENAKIPTLGQLAIFCGGSEDSFTGQLLWMMRKADPGNRARLARIYPGEDLALKLWEEGSSDNTFGDLTQEWMAEARYTPGLHRVEF